MKIFKIVIMGIFLSLGIISTTEAGIARVAKRMNVMEFFSGYALPVGNYNGIDIIDFRNTQGFLVDLNAEDVYDPSYFVGFSYGQLRNNHMFYSLGFRYVKIATEDTFAVEPGLGYIFDPETPNFNQYDIDFNLNYFASNPTVSGFSPYVGVGFHGGITSVTGDNFNIESSNDVTLALGINFGADLTIWKSVNKRAFVTLSSVNEYQFFASDGRPKYLNLGGALKYYFRM
ncbi:MAG: hypothetical protein ACE5D6_04930 [Candidatus Zixiibacteriota bacterium]